MAELTKNSLHEVKISGYSHDGSGIARIDGQVVFVKNAIDGEVCEIKILKAAKNAAYAKIEKIIEPSAHRIEPACPVYGKCGGCSLMHMDYEEEKRFKYRRVQDALVRLGGVDVPLSGITGAEDDGIFRYRNKAIFAVGQGADGRAQTGFFRQRSHDIVPAQRCLLQPAPADAAAEAVRQIAGAIR